MITQRDDRGISVPKGDKCAENYPYDTMDASQDCVVDSKGLQSTGRNVQELNNITHRRVGNFERAGG